MKVPRALSPQGEINPALKATRDSYGETLVKLGEEMPEIVVLDADLSESTRTSLFAKKFPERFFNLGVAEQDMMGTAAGLAAAGKIAFASTFAIFAAGRAWEPVRQSIALPRMNVKVVASHGGVTVGEDGASHHCVEDLALMRVMPNMTVIVPADGPETEQATRAIARFPGPVYMRTGRSKVPAIMPPDYRFTIGKGLVLTPGQDVSIIALGLMVAPALEAAALLEARGVSARVINMPTVKPIDRELIIAAARETGALLTAEEHSIIGGLGSAVAEVASEECPVPLRRIGVGDVPGTSGCAADILEHFGLTSAAIVKGVEALLRQKRG